MNHIVYVTTNLLNGKKYVGVHSTVRIDDGYLGSGLLIRRAIAKYGKENFRREILQICENREESLEREKFWIAELNTKNAGYNLTEGGLVS